MKIGKRFYARTRREWRAWLAKHHKRADCIWLVYYTKQSGKPRVAYSDAVEEALCYGWIDGQAQAIDGKSWGSDSPRAGPPAHYRS